MKKVLANFEEIVAAVFLSVLLVLTICNVALRMGTGRSLAWSEEISYLCFAWVVFVGASAVYKRGMHSSIDILVHFLPPHLVGPEKPHQARPRRILPRRCPCSIRRKMAI